MNEYMTQYLDSYCGLGNVDYAIMISGKWGSGKTFFINKYIGHCKKKFKKADQKFKVAYVSLNGVQNKGEININIFQQLYPAFNKKGVKTSGRMLSAIMATGAVTTRGVQAGLAGIAKAFSELIPSGKIDLLIFDDIERCAMSAEVLLGEISGFLDSGNHVILIGDEEQFSKKMNAGSQIKYENVKEKVVGKTFSIVPSLEPIYEDLIVVFKGTEVFDVLKTCRDDIIDNFDAVKEHGNYRALKAAIREFGFWLERLPETAKKNKEFIKIFAHIFIALSYEHQLGLLTESNFGKMRKRLDNGEDETEYEKVLERHKIVHDIFSHAKPLLLPDEIVRKMIFSQPVEMQELQNVILALPFFESSEDMPTWMRLWNYYELEDGEIKILVRKVKRELSEGKYVRPEEILMIFTILADMSELSLISETVDNIQDMARKYTKRIAQKGELAEPIEEAYEILNHGFTGYSYPGSFDNKQWFTNIRESIICIIKIDEGRKRKKWARSVAGTFGAWNGAFYTRLKTDAKVYGSSIFSIVSSKQFVDGFGHMTNIDKRALGSWLRNRFSRLEASVIEAEKTFWTAVLKRIAQVLDRKRSSKYAVSTIQLKVLHNLINTQYELGLPQYTFRRNYDVKDEFSTSNDDSVI